MDNYGQDYFMSQEGYASIDFTLLDRPSSTVASAPEATAALLPDLHVADSSFSSFDFLDGSGVDAFGGVLREADEAHSRDQGGYRSDLQRYKKDHRSLHQNSVSLQRGDADPEPELQSADFHIPFEVQKPMDFFSQGHTKDSAQGEQQAQSPGNDAADGNQDYFEQGQISQQGTAGGSGTSGWYPSWSADNNQGDQTQLFFQTPYSSESADERRMLQMKGGNSQVATQLGYHGVASTQVQSSEATPKAMHSFLPTAKQNDTSQAANTGLGLPSAQSNPSSSSVIKSLPRSQPFDYEGLMNGANVGQFRPNSAEASPARRQITGETNLAGQDAMRSQIQSQNYKFGGQSLGSLASGVEVSPLKVNDYDFLGSQQYLQKGQGQGQGEQLAVGDMQGWNQQSLLSQSNQQQQQSYQQSYQEIARQELSRQQQQQQRQQQSQHSRQQQLQQFLASSNQNPNLGNQLSAFLSESSLQDIPRVVQTERQNQQMAAENSRSLLQQTNYQAMNNATNLNWSANESSAAQGLAHDYLMGADQNFNWQALALKASQQLDPYGSVSVNRRDTTAQQSMNPYSGMQGGLQDYYGGNNKLTNAAAAAHVDKPVPRNAGGGSSIYGNEYQSNVYDAGNLQTPAHTSKHQTAGKMPFWQNPYPQSVQQNRSGLNVNQSSLPPRSPQLQVNSQGRQQQRNWSISGTQQDGLQSSMLSAEALKQGMIATGMQQSGHQGAGQSGISRAAPGQNMERSQFMQQHSSQAASSSQFLSALGAKQQQSGWNRHALQQTVSQPGVSAQASRSLEGIQKTDWSGLNIHQAGSESQSLSNLKQPNIWSAHSQQQSRPATSSLHLFNDLDGRRSSVQGSQDMQQGSTQTAGSQQTLKFDVNQQGHSLQSANLQVSDPSNSVAEIDTRQQSGWRDHLLLQGNSQASSSLQGYAELDKTSSWRNIWQNTGNGGGTSQMIELDTRQQSSGWGNSMQQTNSQTADSQVASINSREHSSWNNHDIQQESPQTSQFLSSLESQHQVSHLSRTVAGKLHGGQAGHMLYEELSRTKSSAEVDGRLKSNSSPYSLQSQIAMADADARHKGGQMAYGLQPHVGTAESEARLQAGQKLYGFQPHMAIPEAGLRQKSAYSLQSQVDASETDVRLNTGQSSYPVQTQLSVTDNDSRQNVGQNAYSLQTQIGLSETAARQKASQNAYNLQTQVGTGETNDRNKSAANPYSLQSQIGANELDSRQYKGSQSYYNLRTGSAETDIRGKGSQSPYHLQSQGAVESDGRQVGGPYSLQAQTAAAEAEARQKGGHNTYSLQGQAGSFTQPSSVDSRQGRVPGSLGAQGTPQTSNTSYMFPSGAKGQSTTNSLHQASSNAWIPSGSHAEGWQKSAMGATAQQFQQVGMPSQVEALDTRQQSASSSQHGSPQNESQIQATSASRPPSRLGRTAVNSQESIMPGVLGAGPNASAASPWQNHGSVYGSSSTSGDEFVPSWSRGQIRTDADQLSLRGGQVRKDVDQVNLRGDTDTGIQNEVPSPWSRGQVPFGNAESEQLNVGVDSSAAGGSEGLPGWTRSQIMSSRKEDETESGGDDVLPTWSRSQITPGRKDVEQLNIGRESTSSANEVLPSSWSRGHNVDSGRDSRQLNLGQDTAIGAATEAAPAWSRAQVPSGHQESEQLKLRAESSTVNTDSLPAWSRGQHMSARNDGDQINHGQEPITTPASVQKDVAAVRHEAEKRSQEVSFLDAASGRDTNSRPSPAPSPDRNVFPVKEKNSSKISSLSRNTLDLLSKPEEPDESMSMMEEDEDAEEMENEDSGEASISLAHLRRNQASGPLSPQGFGLRLAPPSNLTQNSQVGGLSRTASLPFGQAQDARRPADPSSEQQQVLERGVTEQNQNHGLSTTDADAHGTAAHGKAGNQTQPPLPTQGGTSDIPAFESSYYGNKDYQSAETEDRPSDLFEPDASQLTAPGDKTEKPMASTTVVVESLPSNASINPSSSQALDSSSSRASEENHALVGSLGSTPHNQLSSGPQQMAQQLSSNASGAHSTPSQSVAFSKLLSSVKDSSTGQVKHPQGQQQTGLEKPGADRGMTGMFEALRQSQAGGKLLNGMQTGQWQFDPGQMTNAMKAEVFRRLAQAQAAQAQAQGQASQALHGQVSGGQPEQGNVASVSGQSFASGQSVPGQSIPGVQYNSAQAHHQGSVPGENSAGQAYLRQAQGQGHVVAGNGPAAQAVAQAFSLSGQSHLGHKQSSNYGASGQAMIGGQIPPHMNSQNLASASNQIMAGQQPGYDQQIPSGPGMASAVANNQFAVRQRVPSSASIGSGPEQQTLQESAVGFQSQRALGQSAVTSLFQSEQAAGMQNNALQSSFGQVAPQKEIPSRSQAPSEEFELSAEGSKTLASSGELIARNDGNAANNQVVADRDKIAEEANGGPSVQGPQSHSNAEQYVAPHDIQGGSLKPGLRQDTYSSLQQQVLRQENQSGTQMQAIGQDGRANAQQLGGRQANQGSFISQGLTQEQQGARQDNHANIQQIGQRQENHGTAPQQWPTPHSIDPSQLTDQQFQRLLESQPSIVAALDQYKSDPRLYQLAVAQLRAYFSQQLVARQMAQAQFQQQQARNETGPASTMVRPMADKSAAGTSTAAQLQAAQMQAAQAAQLQSAQAAQLQAAQAGQTAQSGQLVQAAQAAQAAAQASKNASTAARLQYLSQLAQRGHSANGLAQWYPGVAGRPGNAAGLYASGIGDKGPIPVAASASGVVNERSGMEQLGMNRYYQYAGLTPPPAKKRKKEYPPLIPWREAVSQAGGYVSSTSASELEWAAATNRIPDKDPYEEVVDLSDSRSVVLTRAKRRLRFTTHLMQQIIPPVPAIHMASKSVEDRVGATYTLAKLSLTEACRIASIARRIKEVAAARDAEESRIEKERELALKEQERNGESQMGISLPMNLADRFNLRMKQLEGDLQRLQSSPSAMELVKEMHEIDRIGVVNRLAVHQSSLYSLSELPQNRGAPQKYVTTLQMPSTLPEGLMCISL